jgi:hypothetical protein
MTQVAGIDAAAGTQANGATGTTGGGASSSAAQGAQEMFEEMMMLLLQKGMEDAKDSLND